MCIVLTTLMVQFNTTHLPEQPVSWARFELRTLFVSEINDYQDSMYVHEHVSVHLYVKNVLTLTICHEYVQGMEVQLHILLKLVLDTDKW
jgi:hypothetical protein